MLYQINKYKIHSMRFTTFSKMQKPKTAPKGRRKLGIYLTTTGGGKTRKFETVHVNVDMI